MRSLKVLVFESEDLPDTVLEPVIRCMCGNKEGTTIVGLRDDSHGTKHKLQTSFGFACDTVFENIRFEVLRADDRELVAFGFIEDVGRYVHAENTYSNVGVNLQPQGRLKVGLQLLNFPIDDNRPDRCDVQICSLNDLNQINEDEQLSVAVILGDRKIEGTPFPGRRTGSGMSHQVSQKFRFAYSLERDCRIIVTNGSEVVGNVSIDVWETLMKWKLPGVMSSGITPIVDPRNHIIGSVVAGFELWDGSGCADKINRHLVNLDDMEQQLADIALLDADCIERCPDDDSVTSGVAQSEIHLEEAKISIAECKKLAAEALEGDLCRSKLNNAEGGIKKSRRVADEAILLATRDALAAFKAAVQKEWMHAKSAQTNIDKCCASSLRGLRDLPFNERVQGIINGIENVEQQAAQYGAQVDRALNASKTIQNPVVAKATLDEASHARLELEKLLIEAEKLEIVALELVKDYRTEKRKAENAFVVEPLLEGAPPVTPCCWICYC